MERARQLMGTSKVVSQRSPPGDFEECIEPMFEFAAFRCLDFDARLFAVQTIKNADNQREHDSPEELAGGKKDRGHPTDDVAKDRQLIWRDRSLAKMRNKEILNRSV